MPTILVVDDTRTDRELIGKVIVSAGHHVLYAEDGDQAFARASELKPSLILLDVVMPGANGFSTCRKLKTTSATSQIPVVLVTTKATDSDRFWAKKQGADDHISKPFTPNDILNVLRRYVR
jgi:CheY-like chemotaxis protein